MRIKLMSLLLEGKIIDKKKHQKITKDIKSKIDELGRLTTKIDDLKKTLKPLQKKYDELIDIVLPVVDELDSETVRTKNFIFRIIKKGYERKSFQYKKGFLKSLTKVNENTKRILEQILEETKKLTRIKPSYTIDYVGEDNNRLKQWFLQVSFLKKLQDKLKKIVKSLYVNISNIKKGNTELRKLL